MSGKKISKGKRFWERTLKEFEEAELSVGKFCVLKGIGVSTFYQWRTHLNGRRKEKGGFTPLRIEEDESVIFMVDNIG